MGSSQLATYHSKRRQQQAENTHRDIVQAARRLFAARGYAQTSMTDIAREAGVVVQTIYASVGSKREVLRQLNDLIDVEGGVAEIEALLAVERDPREVLRLLSRLTRQIMERCGDIIGTVFAAAGTEPEMAALLQEGRSRHRQGMAATAAALASAGALRAGLSAEEAGQILAVHTSNEVYIQLTRDFGMSFSAAEEWVYSNLETLLLGSSEP